jgi:hypothetical protein
VASLAAETTEILKATREAFAAHGSGMTACRQGLAEITAKVPEHAQILEGIQRDYAASVLLLGEGDPTHPRANDTIQDNLDEVRDHLAEIGRLADLSEARFHAGGFLEAAECLRRAGARQEQAVFRLVRSRKSRSV